MRNIQYLAILQALHEASQVYIVYLSTCTRGHTISCAHYLKFQREQLLFRIIWRIFSSVPMRMYIHMHLATEAIYFSSKWCMSPNMMPPPGWQCRNLGNDSGKPESGVCPGAHKKQKMAPHHLQQGNDGCRYRCWRFLPRQKRFPSHTRTRH
jgi:hypothetical protein